MHVLLGCFAEGNTVEQSYFKGCSLLVSHMSPCPFTVTETAEATAEIISVCSVETGRLSEGH